MIDTYDLLDPWTPDNTETHAKWSPKAYALLQEILAMYRAECFYPEKHTCMNCGKEHIKYVHFSQHHKKDWCGNGWWSLCETCWPSAVMRAWSNMITEELAKPDPLFKLYVES